MVIQFVVGSEHSPSLSLPTAPRPSSYHLNPQPTALSLKPKLQNP